jgi:Alcohol dehydrogenase GroES-like domain
VSGGMRQLFFVKPGRVEWREVPRPVLADPEDALVRPLVVATCDLDTALVRGAAPFPGPFPIGHEGVGEVVEMGSQVATLTPGQRVIIPFQISCGRCGRPQRGRTAACERVSPGAMYGLEPFGSPWGGFLGDLVRVPWADRMLVPLPADLDPVAVASLSDNIPDAWRTIAPYVSDPPGTAVLIVGGAAPSIPFYAIAIARALGVAQVDYLEFPGRAERTGEPGPGPRKAAVAGGHVLASPADAPAGHYTVTVCRGGLGGRGGRPHGRAAQAGDPPLGRGLAGPLAVTTSPGGPATTVQSRRTFAFRRWCLARSAGPAACRGWGSGRTAARSGPAGPRAWRGRCWWCIRVAPGRRPAAGRSS